VPRLRQLCVPGRCSSETVTPGYALCSDEAGFMLNNHADRWHGSLGGCPRKGMLQVTVPTF